VQEVIALLVRGDKTNQLELESRRLVKENQHIIQKGQGGPPQMRAARPPDKQNVNIVHPEIGKMCQIFGRMRFTCATLRTVFLQVPEIEN